MKIAILGFDTEGTSSYAYFAGQAESGEKGGAHQITILDKNPDIAVPAAADSVLGPDYLANLDRFDLIVRTPGLLPHKIFEANPDLAHGKVTTLINEFFKASPTKNIIGVTGTKGKGTTSTLIANMLTAAGKDAHLAGNIGIPALDVLPKLTPESWVVLELSSFQLIDLKCSPAIGVCLMVAPEHLDMHVDMAEYITAKQQLFVWQTYDDVAIYCKDNEYSTTIAAAGNGAKVPYFAPPGAVVDGTASAGGGAGAKGGAISIGGQVICQTSELKLLGEHNWQNVCAAITAVWQITHSVTALRSVLTTFSGLPHRLELVRELDGVHYYDDSFGTTPETAIVAIQAFSQPKVLILGGSVKGTSYDELAKVVAKSDVRQVILTGNTTHATYKTAAPAIEAALAAAGVTNITSLVSDGPGSMAEVVQAARAAAQPGDIVLLSTGSASFDMFMNYKDRAQQFTAAVRALG